VDDIIQQTTFVFLVTKSHGKGAAPLLCGWITQPLSIRVAKFLILQQLIIG